MGLRVRLCIGLLVLLSYGLVEGADEGVVLAVDRAYRALLIAHQEGVVSNELAVQADEYYQRWLQARQTMQTTTLDGRTRREAERTMDRSAAWLLAHQPSYAVVPGGTHAPTVP